MNAKILIVEDEVLIAEYVKDLLEEESHKDIKLAHHKEDAIEYIKSYKPDIILMDINLNGKNSGIELVNQKNTNASVIYLTGQYDYDLMHKALATKPDSYLTKPIKKQDLIAAINLTMIKKGEQVFSFKNGHDLSSINI